MTYNRGLVLENVGVEVGKRTQKLPVGGLLLDSPTLKYSFAGIPVNDNFADGVEPIEHCLVLSSHFRNKLSEEVSKTSAMRKCT